MQPTVFEVLIIGNLTKLENSVNYDVGSFDSNKMFNVVSFALFLDSLRGETAAELWSQGRKEPWW